MRERVCYYVRGSLGEPPATLAVYSNSVSDIVQPYISVYKVFAYISVIFWARE